MGGSGVEALLAFNFTQVVVRTEKPQAPVAPPAEDRWESHAEWQTHSSGSQGLPLGSSEDSGPTGHCRAPLMASDPT